MPKPNKKTPQLKDFLEKSYTLSHSKNYEKFLQELGVKKNTRKHALNSKPTVVLSQLNDDEYVLDTIYPEGRRVKVKFKIGKEIQRRRANGRPATSIFRTSDNKLVEEQYSDGRRILIEREFGKNLLTVMMEVNGVQCQRFYTVKTSECSIGTETSRRLKIFEVESKSEESSIIQTVPHVRTDSEDEFCL